MNGTATAKNESYMDENDIQVNELEDSSDDRIPDKSNDNNLTKNIILYRNGDKYFPPKRFVVNKRYIRTWDVFLEELTKSIQPRNGAIRDIRTPFHGTRIKSLDDLTVNGKYVAVSKGEIIKLIDYANVIDVAKPVSKVEREARRLKAIHFKPTNHEMDGIENRINQQLTRKGFFIYVYRNGDPFTRGIKIILNQFDQKQMSTLVRAIEERVLLQSNRPIRRIYTMDGTIIRYAKDVENGQYYVAAANEPFSNIKYGQYLPVIRAGKVPSSRARIKFLNKSPTPVTSRNPHLPHETNEETYESQRAQYTDRGRQQPLTGRNRKRNDSEENEHEAAKKIQTAYRRYSARNRSYRDEDHPNQKESNKGNRKKENNKSKNELRNADSPVHDKDVEKSEEKHNFERERKYSENKNKRYPPVLKKEESNKNDSMKDRQSKDEAKKEEPKKEETKKEALKKEETKKEDSKKSDPKGNNTKKEESKNETSKNEKTNKSDNDKKLIERHLAASKIQAGFRGYMVRKKMVKDNLVLKPEKRNAEPKEDNRKKEEPKKKDDKEIKKDENNKKDNNENNDEERDKAAIKIQSGFRAFKTRETFRNRDETERKEKAAKTIQFAYRGYLTRRLIDEKQKSEEREKAAVKIQAGFRGLQTRKTIDSDLKARLQEKTAEEQARERNSSASKIQAGFRGYKKRSETNQ